TLVQIYQLAARSHPKPNTLNYKRNDVWVSMSAAEMLSRSRRIALGLYALGVRKGDRVGIIAESCVEWVLADQGCIFAGAITVPVYPTLTAPQVQYILKDCLPNVVFVAHPEKFAEIESALAECASLSHVVFFAGARATAFETLTLADLEERGKVLDEQQPLLADELANAAHADDLATIIYTSGTTGEPKGVMLTHQNMVSNLIDSSNHLEFGDDDSALSVLPLSHIFERQAMNMYLHHGMSAYFGSLETLGEHLREVHPTVLVGVPRIYEKILARVLDKAAAKGKLNASLVHWAIRVGQRWAQ